jgi:hypothetical protein
MEHDDHAALPTEKETPVRRNNSQGNQQKKTRKPP